MSREGRYKLVVALGDPKRLLTIAGRAGTLFVKERLHTHMTNIGSIKAFHIARCHRRRITPRRVALEAGEECLK